jgi:hypothetical protein
MWLAVDDTNVYVSYISIASGFPADVVKSPVTGGDGGTFTRIGDTGEGHFPSRIVSDGVNVYWRNPGAVMVQPVAGGMGQVLASANAGAYSTRGGLASGGYVAPLSMDSSSIYTIDGANIVRIAKATGVSTTLVTAGGPVAAIAVDDTRVYWSETSFCCGIGSVAYLKSAPLTGGGSSVILADDFTYLAPAPVISDIVVNESNIYWAANGNNAIGGVATGVWRLAK